MAKKYGIIMTAVCLLLAAGLGFSIYENLAGRRSLAALEAELASVQLALEEANARTETRETEDKSLLAVVNGQEIFVYEAEAEYLNQASYYQMFGMGEADLEQLRADITESHVRYAVLLQKCSALGFDVLTAEEYARIREEAQAQYEEAYAYYLSDALQSGLDEESAASQVAAFLEEQSYSVDQLTDTLCEDTILARLYAYATDDIELTEDALKAYYEEKLAEDQTRYAESPLSFEYDVADNIAYTYVPTGFRAVKHIFLLADDESQTRLAEIKDRLAAIALEAAAEGADEAALADERGQLEAERATLYERIDGGRIAKIEAALAEGASFESLIEQYGEDPAMQTEPYRTKGYYVSETSELYDEAFQAAAMKLTSPGDVSEPVYGATGIHMLRYEGDVASGPIPYAEIRDSLSEEALIARKEAAYRAASEAWYQEAEIASWPENLAS